MTLCGVEGLLSVVIELISRWELRHSKATLAKSQAAVNYAKAYQILKEATSIKK